MKILFKNAKILNVKDSNILEGNVEVKDDIIVKVGNFELGADYDRVIDCKGNILMPGFVNAHAHTPMTLLRSFKDDAPLDEWLFDNVLPAENKLSPDNVYWGEYLGVMESVRAGIVALEEGYFHNDKVYAVLNKSGMRARIGIGPALRDTGMSNMEYLTKELNLINTTDSIQSNLFIHAIYTTPTQVIKESLDFAYMRNIPLSIHLAETRKEFDDCKIEHHKTPVEYLNDLGFWRRNVLCYHAVHLTDSDMDILSKNNVSIATCPSSNIKLVSGVANIAKMQSRGINVCIGTDGVASNNSLDMFKEMFLVATLSKLVEGKADVVPAGEVLKMATLNGALALGFNSGEIAPGKLADIILIDINSPHYYPQDNLIEHLVYAGKSSDVYLTMIGGKIVYEEGQYNIGEDINEIYTQVNKIRQGLR